MLSEVFDGLDVPHLSLTSIVVSCYCCCNLSLLKIGVIWPLKMKLPLLYGILSTVVSSVAISVHTLMVLVLYGTSTSSVGVGTEKMNDCCSLHSQLECCDSSLEDSLIFWVSSQSQRESLVPSFYVLT